MASADTISRDIVACPGSEPPPKDQNNERHGDWVINCPGNEPVNVTSEAIELYGNVTIISGSTLHLSNGAKLKQLYSLTQRYFFIVQEGSVLEMEGNSELHTDTFISRPTSDVDVRDSKIYSGGNFNTYSSVFIFADSYLINQALTGGTGKDGAEARLILDGENSSFLNSVFMSFGGQGGAGDIGVEAGIGGDSYAMISASAGIINNVYFNISGGHGGRGKDSYTHDGSSGGTGGDVRAEVITSDGGTLTIVDSDIHINGGAGGRGGNGAMGQSTHGGDGGRGEMGGEADLSIVGRDLDIKASTILVQGGDGGRGGTGGEAAGSTGGNGGNGGRGGNTVLNIDSNGPFNIEDSSIRTIGGDGANGGFFGWGGQGMGNAGHAGGGGQSTFNLGIDGYYFGTSSDLLTISGDGGVGGLGALVAGDGGDGGHASFQLNTTNTFVNVGVAGDLSQIGAIGGDGGWGGDAVGSSGTGGGMRGRGGDGGDSTTTISAPSNIDLTYTHMRAAVSHGGEGSKYGANGMARLYMLTTFFNATDGLSDWTFEGFDGTDRGVLRNFTVDAPQRAYVESNETQAQVEVWWYLRVNVPLAAPDEIWTIDVYQGNMDDNVKVGSAKVTGPHKYATFFLKGELVDWHGSNLFNYTVYGYIEGTSNETEAQNLVLTHNKDVYLQTSGNYFAPKITVSSPEENTVIWSNKLAPCRDPTAAEVNQGILPPGCLQIEGDASEDDRDSEGAIQDVMVILEHEVQGTFIYRNSSQPPVVLRSPGSRATQWYFNWEVGQYDRETGQFIWDEGLWKITVKCFDGEQWSDDLEYDGKIANLTIDIVHGSPPVPSPTLDAGFPLMTEIPYDENGVLVTFKDAEVVSSPDARVIRMEWDYNNDGVADWSYVPSDCGPNGSCTVPDTEYLYEDPGFWNAQFCVMDNFGRKTCDNRMVAIQSTVAPATFGVPNEWLLVVTVFIICISSVITTALIIASLSEAAKFAIMSFILVPLYTRLKKEEMLDNYTRGEIRGYIVANPGAHYSRIKRDLHLNNGTLIYHLRTLEREGFIYSHRDDYYRRFYPRGRKPRPGPNLTTVQESIIEILLLEPNQTALMLAKELEKSRKVVNYHLVWLRRWGLVESKKEGRKKIYSVIYEDDVEMEEDSPDLKAEVGSKGL